MEANKLFHIFIALGERGKKKEGVVVIVNNSDWKVCLCLCVLLCERACEGRRLHQ
jgi:hypothetical protein